jgi:alanine-glyoxylate transaminase/serine-glyoxylate transaminase/serine-pyruvate transaminase
MEDVAGRLGADVDTLEFEWGTPVDPEQVQKQISKKDYRIVGVVHAETSTGVANPVSEIGNLVRETEALFLVDTVTSLGGMPVQADAWGVDALYSGTQKCLSCPPGLAPVTFSERAVEKTMQRKTKVPNWYLDLSMIVNYWEGEKRAYHHTAPINMLYGLYQALGLIMDEGPENVFRRHLDCHLLLVETLGDMGMSLFVDPDYRLPMLNAVVIPEGINVAQVRSRLLSDHRIEIGAGLGPLAGKIWRIGVMGHTARPENISRLAAALSDVL